MNRRTWLKWLAAAPVYGVIATRAATQSLAAATGGTASGEVYRRLGVRPFINARGTWTYLSGSLELPEVRRAMDDAAQHFVDIFELQKAAGRKLAQLSGAESGMVTSGAAGAMAAATAGCMAGTDPNKVWQLPDTTGMKNEVVMLGGRSAFDSAIRLAGAKLVVVGSVDDLAGALTDRTAMVYTTWLGDRLNAALAVTKKAGVPLLLDDAAGIPPIENLKTYAQMGIDLFCFSGGKGLRGPQCSGILLGRKDLIEAALAQCSPWEGAVCRAMKVGKEEIVGVLTAVETWTETGPRHAQQAMVAARRAHREARGDRAGRPDEHQDPRGWQQLPDADGVVGLRRRSSSPWPTAIASCAPVSRASRCSRPATRASCPPRTKACRQDASRPSAGPIACRSSP